MFSWAPLNNIDFIFRFLKRNTHNLFSFIFGVLNSVRSLGSAAIPHPLPPNYATLLHEEEQTVSKLAPRRARLHEICNALMD
jgi:hypothetical protein